jgi:hypothetical protein
MIINFLSFLESSLLVLILNAVEQTIQDTGRFGYSDDIEID